MNTIHCCHKRGWLKASGGVLPGVAAILLPKCPLCVAAWIAAGTGVALPTAMARGLRPALAIACVLSLLVLLRLAKRRSGKSY